MAGTPSTGRALHVDIALSNTIINRRPQGFIADAFVPIVQVDKQTDFFWKYDHLEFKRFTPNLSRRSPGAAARKIGMTVSTDTYIAQNYALGVEWTIEDEVNADEVLQWAQTQSELLMDALMVDYEMRIADICTNSSNVGTVTTIASQWSDPDNSSPFDDLNIKLENFRQRTGVRANTLIIPEPVMVNLRRNAQLRSILFGDGAGLVDEARLASLFPTIDQVLVPWSMVNTAGEQETINGSGTLSDIWGNHCWLMHKNAVSGRNVDSWITGFRWTNPRFTVPFAVRRLPFDTKHLKQEIDVHYYQAEKIVSADLGERIADVI